MTVLGALLAASAVACVALAVRPRSRVLARLAWLDPHSERPRRIRILVAGKSLLQSGLGWSETQLLAAKTVTGIACVAIAAAAALVLPIPLALIALAGYGGFVAPTLHVERIARRARARAERAVVTFVEWTMVLVESGRPVETATIAIAQCGLGSALVDGILGSAARAYALGAPLYPALAREAEALGISSLASLATELDRSRGLGRGALTVLRDERERLRADERARSLDAAGRVEGHLMLILVLCYLPALMLLVVIPLFLGLLDGLFV